MERPSIPPLVVFWWNIVFEDDRLGTVCHALRVTICPYTRSEDLIILVRPIIASLVATVSDSNGIIPCPINRIAEIFYTTTISQPSHHPRFIIITVFEETIHDLLVTGLAGGELFGVRPEPERVHPQDSLLRIPNDVFECEPKNTGDVIQALRRGVTGDAD